MSVQKGKWYKRNEYVNSLSSIYFYNTAVSFLRVTKFEHSFEVLKSSKAGKVISEGIEEHKV